MVAFFFIIYAATLTIPGIAISRLFNLRLDRMISAVTISYVIFTLSFIGANYFSVKADSFLLYTGLLLVTAVVYLIISRRKIDSPPSARLLPILAISILSLGYQLVLGSFIEVPADIYTHLERYQFSLRSIQSGSFGQSLSPSQLFLQGSGVFYYLIASINYVTPISVFDLINVIDFSNRTIFLIATYFFSHSIFKENQNSHSIASITTLFVFLHFGISVFSYARYYTIAPTMLNMVLYMFGILSALHVFTNQFSRTSGGYYVLIGLVVICAAAIHVQEAIYILVMIACFSVVAVISSLRRSIAFPIIAKKQAWLIFALTSIGFLCAYIYSSQNLVRAPNAHWRLWDFGIHFWPLPQLTVLNLKKEFAQVITLWGLLVYFLFFLNLKRYRKNLFVVAAMLSPILTILNPFFVDLFLRHYNSTTLWRFCYLIPIHLVGADLFLYYFQQTKTAAGFKQSIFAIPVALLVLLLMPYKNTWEGWHYSRSPSLTSSNSSLSASGYRDLIDFLSTITEKKTILTDPMTGYMLSAMTKHYSPRRKFFRDHKFIHFSFNDYNDKPLDRHSGKLLVANSRPKSKSQVGELSNHWQADQWLTSRYYYPNALIEHLENRTEKFEMIWSNNQITIYKIK